ncbi:MAG: polyprenyl synthetase family protein [Candidatus Bathyarchaeia archaeon]
MSLELMRQLRDVTKSVNGMIDKILGAEQEPRVLYRASRHLIEAGGKRLRPFMVMKSCEIVGGRSEDSLPVAAAVELLHNFTLIHDDIMDGDSRRRGAPTVHVLWGTPIAINAGDLLFAKVYDSVIHHIDTERVPVERVIWVLDILSEATIAICEGQTLDMLYEERETISEVEYLDMIGKKTAALLKASAQAGAIVGGGSRSQIDRLGSFAYQAGLAFQIVDDILGLTADEKTLGKPVGSDIREGKRTLIIAHALSHANDKQRRLILSTLGDRDASPDRAREVTETIRSLGAIDYAAGRAKGLIEEAKLQLSLFPDSPAKRLFLDLSDFILSRSY